MSNNIAPYDNYWYANRALERLEKNLMLTKTIYREYDAEPGSKGKVTKIRRPGGFTAYQYPTMTTNDLDPFERTLTLDQFWHVTFGVKDDELAYSGQRVIDEHIAPAMQALANQIETVVADMLLKTGGRTIATGPAAIADLTALRKALNERNVPAGDRYLALGAALEQEFLNIAAFTSAQDNADGGRAQVEGILGRKYGFNTYFQPTLPALVASTIAGTGTIAAVVAQDKGVETIVINGSSTLTGIARKGFQFTIAGDAQVYTVTADATAAGNNVSVGISPPLQKAIAASPVVTLGALTGYGTVACAYHQHAFGIKTANLGNSGNGKGASQASVVDPRTNLSIRVTQWYDPDNAAGPTNKVRFDALFGVTPLENNMAQGYLDA